MIKKLQIKFVVIIMIAVVIISGSMIGLIIIENYRTMDRQSNVIIDLIVENNGTMPEYKTRDDEFAKYITKETQFSTRYFTVEIDDSGNIINSDMQNIAMVAKEEVDNILDEVNYRNKTSGYYNNFMYRVIEHEENIMIIFLDCSTQINNFKTTTQKSIIITLAGWCLVGIIVTAFSKKILSPIIQSSERQKQFITNASHELKTPLAVITADIDVLELTADGGEKNEWIESIKNQTNKLNILVKSLLSLSNIEEGQKIEISNFSITDVVKEEIGDFKPLAKTKNIIFDDSTNIMINADKNLLRQLLRILLDNSIKYTPDNGIIKIVVSNQGKNTKIEVSNTCENAKNINTKKLFERFYREDKSRNKAKDGYGIGLSIAKSIVDLHGGKISADITKDNMIHFKVIL